MVLIIFLYFKISLNLPELPTDLEEKQRQEELLRLKFSLELSSTATEQQQTSNSDERGNLSKKLRRQEESFEQLTSADVLTLINFYGKSCKITVFR